MTQLLDGARKEAMLPGGNDGAEDGCYDVTCAEKGCLGMLSLYR